MKDMVLNEHSNALQADELSRAVYNCSMTGRKIIAFAASKLQEKELKDNAYFKSGALHLSVPCAEFKISELLKALNLTKCGENYEIVKKATRELRSCSVEIKEDDDEFRIWNWFQFIQYSKKKDKIELHFSEEIGWALMDLQKNYCSLDLHTVGEFKSFYAFRFYEIALSWKGMKGRKGNAPGNWWFQMTPEEIRTTFKIDDNLYRGKDGIANFVKKVIQIPLNELNSICSDFKIEVLKIKRGRNLVAFRFDCTEFKKQQQQIFKSDNKELRQEKRQINEEYEEIEYFKNKYPNDFVKALAEAKAQATFPGIPRMEMADIFEAVKLMKQWGLK